MSDVLTPEGINSRHRERVADWLQNPVGSLLDVQEIQRREWVEYVAQRDGTRSPEAVVTHKQRVTKAGVLSDWLGERVGQIVTPDDMAAACEGSRASAHAYINDHRAQFRKVSPGRYEILDVAELRKAAKSGTADLDLLDKSMKGLIES